MAQYALVKTKLVGKSLRVVGLSLKVILKMCLKMGSKVTSNKRKLPLRPRSISITRNSLIFQKMEQR